MAEDTPVQSALQKVSKLDENLSRLESKLQSNGQFAGISVQQTHDRIGPWLQSASSILGNIHKALEIHDAHEAALRKVSDLETHVEQETQKHSSALELVVNKAQRENEELQSQFARERSAQEQSLAENVSLPLEKGVQAVRDRLSDMISLLPDPPYPRTEKVAEILRNALELPPVQSASPASRPHVQAAISLLSCLEGIVSDLCVMVSDCERDLSDGHRKINEIPGKVFKLARDKAGTAQQASDTIMLAVTVENSNLEAAVDVLKRENAVQKTSLETLTSENNEVTRDLAERNASVEALTTENGELRSSVTKANEQLVAEKSRLEEVIASKETQVFLIAHERDQTQDALDSHCERYESLIQLEGQAKRDLETEQASHNQTRTELQQQLDDERGAHTATKKDLEEEQTSHCETRSELEQQLVDRKNAHAAIEKRLEEEQTSHRETRSQLQEQLDSEKKAHEVVEKGLQAEQKSHRENRSQLQQQLVDQKNSHAVVKEDLAAKLKQAKKNLREHARDSQVEKARVNLELQHQRKALEAQKKQSDKLRNSLVSAHRISGLLGQKLDDLRTLQHDHNALQQQHAVIRSERDELLPRLADVTAERDDTNSLLPGLLDRIDDYKADAAIAELRQHRERHELDDLLLRKVKLHDEELERLKAQHQRELKEQEHAFEQRLEQEKEALALAILEKHTTVLTEVHADFASMLKPTLNSFREEIRVTLHAENAARTTGDLEKTIADGEKQLRAHLREEFRQTSERTVQAHIDTLREEHENEVTRLNGEITRQGRDHERTIRSLRQQLKDADDMVQSQLKEIAALKDHGREQTEHVQSLVDDVVCLRRVPPSLELQEPLQGLSQASTLLHIDFDNAKRGREESEELGSDHTPKRLRLMYSLASPVVAESQQGDVDDADLDEQPGADVDGVQLDDVNGGQTEQPQAQEDAMGNHGDQKLDDEIQRPPPPQVQPPTRPFDNQDTPQGKAEQLRNCCLFAWNYTAEEERTILSYFTQMFSATSTTRTLQSTVDAVEKMCSGTEGQSSSQPGLCLIGKLLRRKTSSNPAIMTQSSCVYCKAHERICLWAKYAPGITPGNNDRVILGGQEVRWILKKRRAGKDDAQQEFFDVNGLVV